MTVMLEEKVGLCDIHAGKRELMVAARFAEKSQLVVGFV